MVQTINRFVQIFRLFFPQTHGHHMATATQAIIFCNDRTIMACLLVIISEHIQHESVQSQPAGSSFQGRKLFEHWSTYEEACLEFSKLVNHVPKVFLGTVWTFRWFDYMFHKLNWLVTNIAMLKFVGLNQSFFFIGLDQFQTKNF